MAMVAASIRRQGVLAWALSSSLHGKSSSAFQHDLLLRLSSSPSRIVLRRKSSAANVSDDPSLKVDDDHEWLKQSRPVRIHARLISPYDIGNGESYNSNTMGSSLVTKVVHFQRHGQGTHNELYRQWTEATGTPPDLSETDPEKNPMVTDAVLDAPLTQKGINQCAEQRSAASKLRGVELIVSSPLTRALQTAHLTFCDHLPSRAPRKVRWIAHEGVREELGTLLCNKRRPFSETRSEFPAVDFAHLPNCEEDIVWNHHAEQTSGDDGVPRRESVEDLSHRAYDFLVDFVYPRPEREMAVVGHSAWLHAMTGAVLDAGEDEESITPMFGQAELRSMELVFLEQ